MHGQQIVLTGGKGDLAKSLAAEFRMRGADVCAAGRDLLDVTNGEQVRDFFANRKTDLLVCCAGVAEDELLIRQSPEGMDRVWEINYLGARCCAVAAIPGMIAQGRGHIVFLSSHSALRPPVGQTAYAMAKRALLGLTMDLAAAHGPHNIRINAVLPGFLENRMTAAVSKTRKERVRLENALGRFNTADDVARFIGFLHMEMPNTSAQWFQLDSRPSVH